MDNPGHPVIRLGLPFRLESAASAEHDGCRFSEETLSELYQFFREVGFPTRQIAPGNRHAYTNFIRDRHGALKIIDLESSLVSVSYPMGELRAALRVGNFPVFDDVDFAKLRGETCVNHRAPVNWSFRLREEGMHCVRVAASPSNLRLAHDAPARASGINPRR
jgi:hypothetical protein